jgi:hypothetical protein
MNIDMKDLFIELPVIRKEYVERDVYVYKIQKICFPIRKIIDFCETENGQLHISLQTTNDKHENHYCAVSYEDFRDALVHQMSRGNYVNIIKQNENYLPDDLKPKPEPVVEEPVEHTTFLLTPEDIAIRDRMIAEEEQRLEDERKRMEAFKKIKEELGKE